MPQEINFNQFERPDQIVLQQAGYYGIARRDALSQTEHSLRAMGLWDRRSEPARQLSGGMKRRLMIARALVHRPRLLILDEPTAGVDIELRRTTWKMLEQINDDGTTIILTTHYLEEAESLCRRIAIIDHGTIVENSTTKELLAKLKVETFIVDTDEPLRSLPELGDFDARLIESGSLEVDVDRHQSLNQLFSALERHGIVVRSLRNKANRLEELFVRLTDSTAAAPATGASDAA